jgi:hypothetical protein
MWHPINALRGAVAGGVRTLRELFNDQTALRQEYEFIKNQVALRMPGNPALSGYKVYSQFDEDGIIANIFSAIGDGGRIFVEIGCSNGLENNSHALLLKGWRGVWIDADASKINFIAKRLPANPLLVLKQAFVNVENVQAMVSDAISILTKKEIDFLSIDIDGDDLNVLSALLQKNKPRVICVEYNAKFPPPMKLKIQAERKKFWEGDDYHGASLACFTEVLGDLGYALICCGLSGVNAFFVRNCDAAQFPSFTAEQLFQPARYSLRRLASGHPSTLNFLADRLLDAGSLHRPSKITD